MEKKVSYPYAYFDEATIRRAMDTLRSLVAEGTGRELTEAPSLMHVMRSGETWSYDTVDELLADLVSAAKHPASLRVAGMTYAVYPKNEYDKRAALTVQQFPDSFDVEVGGVSRAGIERVHEIFRSALPSFHRPPPVPAPKPKPALPKPRVFIGHGGASSAWRDLKDHLADKHGYEVIAYETGNRAGHTIRDILDEMMGSANFAILVMTAGDEQSDGAMRARQNVVHEAGLFQGRLGFPRAIIILQDGVENFSNIDGVQYLPFTNTIRETFGDVLATIKREFPV